MLLFELGGKTLKMDEEFECSFFERKPEPILPDHLFDLTLNPNEMFTHFFGSQQFRINVLISQYPKG